MHGSVSKAGERALEEGGGEAGVVADEAAVGPESPGGLGEATTITVLEVHDRAGARGKGGGGYERGSEN